MNLAPALPLHGACLPSACLLGGYGLGVRERRPSPAPPDASLSAADRAAFQVVWETLGQVERDYYRSDQLDPKKLAAGAARGLVEAVGDPYTKLLDAQQSRATCRPSCAAASRASGPARACAMASCAWSSTIAWRAG